MNILSNGILHTDILSTGILYADILSTGILYADILSADILSTGQLVCHNVILILEIVIYVVDKMIIGKMPVDGMACRQVKSLTVFFIFVK